MWKAFALILLTTAPALATSYDVKKVKEVEPGILKETADWCYKDYPCKKTVSVINCKERFLYTEGGGFVIKFDQLDAPIREDRDTLCRLFQPRERM